MSPLEANTACFPQAQENVCSLINDLTRSFVIGSLKILMKRLEVDCGALFLLDPVQGELILDSLEGTVLSVSFMSIPLFARGELFGLLKIGTKTNGRNFTREDLRFASVLCDHVCRIVEDQIQFTKTRAEMARVARERSALDKYRSVGSMSAGIVGEINSPLDGALRYTGLMISHLDGNPQRLAYLIEIKKGLERISEITANLSRMGNFRYARSADMPVIDIHQLLNEAIDVFSAAFKSSIRITVKYKGPLRVRMDKSIKHVFTNIIKNAIDAMPSGGELEICSEVKLAGLQLCFRDTGCGIREDHQERIFEPFYTTKPKGSGTGLGLPICRDLVAKHGGRIGVKSAPGKGSTFTILFPREILAQ
jgi:two-component system NtrC family sensor kinase